MQNLTLESVDKVEAELQHYMDNFTKLVEVLTTAPAAQDAFAATEYANKLNQSKLEIIKSIESLPFLSKPDEELRSDLEAYELKHKEVLEASKFTNERLQSVEASIKEALDALQNRGSA